MEVGSNVKDSFSSGKDKNSKGNSDKNPKNPRKIWV